MAMIIATGGTAVQQICVGTRSLTIERAVIKFRDTISNVRVANRPSLFLESKLVRLS